jgi:hypothetical protein
MIDNDYINIDLINDLSNILKDDITEMGYDMSTIAHDKILLLYNELLMRLIVPCKRKIEIAKEFSCPAELETGLEQLKQKIIDGESINGHLSRKIKSIDYDDKMLYDWDVHHLHLGTEIDPRTGLIRGTKDVVFTVFKEETAYFIQILDHQQWSNKDVLTIIESNWPFLLSQNKVDGEPEVDLTQEEILKLRGKNINTILKLPSGNSYVAIGGGYNGLGSSLKALNATFNLNKTMLDNELIIYNQVKRACYCAKTICHMKRIDETKLSIIDNTNKNLNYIDWKSLVSIYGHL